MAYYPPAGNAVLLNFTSPYTPPAGNAVNLNFHDSGISLVVPTFTYNIAPSSISLYRSSYYKTVNVNTYNLTLNNISFSRNRKMSITTGVFTLNLYLEIDTTFVISPSSSTLTFNNIGLNKGPVLFISPFVFNTTLNPISFSSIKELNITPLELIATISPVELNKGWTFTIDSNSYTLTHNDILFSSRDYAINISTGSFTINDSDIVIQLNKSDSFSGGSFDLTFNDIGLSKTTIFSISTANSSVNSIPISFNRKTKFPINTLYLTSTIADNYRFDRVITFPITTLALTDTHNSIGLLKGNYLTFGTSYTLTNTSFNLKSSRLLPISVRNHALTFNPIALSIPRVISISKGEFSFQENEVYLLFNRYLGVSSVAYNSNYYLSNLLLKRYLGVNPLSLSIQLNNTLNYARIFSINTHNLTLSDNPISMYRGFIFPRDVRVIINNPIKECQAITDLTSFISVRDIPTVLSTPIKINLQG